MLKISIPGDPVGKGRPRFARVGGFVRTFTPEPTRRWEDNCAVAARQAWGSRAPFDAPVILEVVAVAARPTRLLRKKDPAGRIWRTTKPDCDNVVKAVEDGLVKGGVLRDDALIVELHAFSFYAARHEGPSVEIKLTDMETKK